jgi:hypothetical protein
MEGYVYLAVSALRMFWQAWEKHEMYLNEFDGKSGGLKYPHQRKALIPGLF